MLKSICLAFIVAIGFSTSASAATFFTDRVAFDAATNTTLENFNTTAVGNFVPWATLPGFTAFEAEGVNLIGIANDEYNSGAFKAVTNGSNALVYDDNGGSIGKLLNFSSQITALGLNITTSVDAMVSISGPRLTSTTINTTANAPLFFGIVELAGITSIAFDVSGAPLVGFDDVAYGAAVVPIPAAFPLFASALAGLGFFGWRRKRASNAV